MVLRTLSIGLAIFGSLSGAVAPAHANWIENGTAIVTEAFNQTEPESVSDGSGGAIIMWVDSRNGSNWDIYAQRVDISGKALWPAGGVAISTAASHQAYASITSDGSGGAIITWQDLRGGVTHDIYAQRVDATGSIVWTTDGVVICAAANEQEGAEIASDGSGGAIITWQDHRAGTRDTYAQRVDGSGNVRWATDGVIMCTAANNQIGGQIAADGAGGAIITWRDYRSGATYDIYAQHVDGSGNRLWGSTGLAICTAANSKIEPTLASDGTGGAIIVWSDYRTGADYNIYAQRVDAAGTTLWAPDGVAICSVANDQRGAGITSDGSGGAVVIWEDYRSGTDYDIYAQRVAGSGNVLWITNGKEMCTAFRSQTASGIVSDGAGGAIATWLDYRSGSDAGVYAQRVDESGNVKWGTSGVAVSTAIGAKFAPWISSDGAGGALIAWQDLRNGIDDDIYAQRIERYGYWGYPAPSIAGTSDVPGDQGGLMNLSWDASRLDPWPEQAISHYTLWRATSPQGVAPLRSEGARLIASPSDVPAGASGGVVRLELTAAGTWYWELIQTVTAYYLPGYAATVPTLFDSTATSSDFHYFQVIAHGLDPSTWWVSAPDSGQSVDNLAPAAPQNLAGEQVSGAGGLLLTWDPNVETDLSHYTVYRGTSAGFIPGPSNLLGEPPDTFQTDGAWQWDSGDYYKVAAVDIHGNESVFAVLGPDLATGIDPARVPAASFLSQNHPNPFSRDTGIPFGLSREENVTIRVYDVRGRLVRTLVDERRKAAAQTITWDGRDARGAPVAAGVYFYRLEAGAFVQTKKMVVVR